MPRSESEHDRIDRLLALARRLQPRVFLRAEDLAREFGVSRRTIYRDLDDLAQRYPIRSVTGKGFTLASDGHAELPPLSLRSNEAVALILGADFVAQNLDDEMERAAGLAIRKIIDVLPEKARSNLAYLRPSLRFLGSDAVDPSRHAATLRTVRIAILDKRVVRFSYQPRYYDDEPLTERVALPYGLVYQNAAWYLVGYDRTRRAIRNFRVDRIDRIEPLEETFRRPKDFQPQLHSVPDTRNLEVRALFDAESARWVREEQNFFVSGEQAGFSGELLVTLRAHREDEVVPWLLSWGSHVRVLEPESVRGRIAAEAAAVLAAHAPVD